jgi:hypothetical protein
MPTELWPEWACDEDGEYWWIRGDIAARNDLGLLPDLRKMDIVTSVDEAGIWGNMLVFEGKVVCWIDRAPDPGIYRDWSEWRLHELHGDDPADDALVYWTFISTSADYIASDDVVFGATS